MPSNGTGAEEVARDGWTEQSQKRGTKVPFSFSSI